MSSSVTRGCRLFTVILVPSKGLRTGYQRQARYQRQRTATCSSSRTHSRQVTRRAPVRGPQCPSCPHRPVLRVGASRFPHMPVPLRPEPLHGTPLLIQDPPSSGGALSLKPSWVCPAELAALSSGQAAVSPDTVLCLQWFSPLAWEHSAQGPLGLGLLMCKMGAATPTSERR